VVASEGNIFSKKMKKYLRRKKRVSNFAAPKRREVGSEVEKVKGKRSI
jgi:hypothetical protein